MVLGKLDRYVQKSEARPPSYTMQGGANVGLYGTNYIIFHIVICIENNTIINSVVCIVTSVNLLLLHLTFKHKLKRLNG